MWLNYFVAFQTIVFKELRRMTRIWVQTLLPPVITMALYFIIFGNLLGSHFGVLHGVSYAQYITPGLVMMAVINNAYANVSFSYYSAKFQNTVDELLIAPISMQLIFWAYVTGGIIRGILIGILVMLVAACFTPISMQHIGLALLIVLLAATLFSIAGFINALYAKNFDAVSIIPAFVLTPLTYLGGVFYSINMLPPVWQKVSLFNPIFYIIDAFRFTIVGSADVNILSSIGIIIVFVLVFYAIAMLMLKARKGIRM